MPPKASKKSPKADSKKQKGQAESSAPPAEAEFPKPPPSKYCGFDLTDKQLECIDTSLVDEYRVRFDPDIGFPECFYEESPIPCTSDESIAEKSLFKYPCVSAWARAKATQLVAQPVETAEAGPTNNMKVDPVNTASEKDAKHEHSSESASKEAPSSSKSENEVTGTGDSSSQQVPCDYGCEDYIPCKEVLMKMYHFAEYELEELLEAFLYFAKPMIPVPKPVPAQTVPQSDISSGEKESKKTKRGKSAERKTSGKDKGADKGPTNEGSPEKVKSGKKKGKSSDASPATPQDEEVKMTPPSRPLLGLTRCTFARCLRSIDQNPSETDLGLMLRLAGAEPITVTSYLYAVDCWTLRSVCLMENDLWHAFKVFDLDDSGQISVYHLRTVLACCGEPLDPEDLDELLCLADPPPHFNGLIDIAHIVHKLIRPTICPRRDPCAHLAPPPTKPPVVDEAPLPPVEDKKKGKAKKEKRNK